MGIQSMLLFLLSLNVVMFVGFGFAVKRLGIPGWRKTISVVLFGAVLFGWFFLMARLGESGTFAQGEVITLPPPILIALLAPIVVFLAVFRFLPSAREVATAVPLTWLIGVQVTRVLGAVFLVRYAQGKMPGEFAIPAGVGDVLIGLTAIPVAWAVFNRRRNAKTLARFWNWAGILDLVIAIFLGFSTSPTPLQWLALDRPSQLDFPLVMVPTFGVPLMIILHLLSLWIIRHRWPQCEFENQKHEAEIEVA